MHFAEASEIALVMHELPRLQVQNVRANLIQEIGVVRDDDDRVRVLLGQVLVQPQHRVEVQVIGRFVQHKQFRLQEQGLGQTDPHPPTAGKLHDRAVHGEAVLIGLLRREPEPAHDLAHLGLCGLGTRRAQLRRDILELGPRLFQLLGGHLPAPGLHRLLHFLEFLEALLFSFQQVYRGSVRGQNLLDCRPVAGLGLLLHEDHIPVLRHGQVPRGDVPEDRRLSHAIRAKDPVALSLLDGDLGVVEKRLPWRGQREVLAREDVAPGRRLFVSVLEDERKNLHLAVDLLVPNRENRILFEVLLVQALLLVT
mmetsp:Transcript_53318/g.161942  ORF Transcript_53318/g.161942 Transcript_53318/m.161942 type:complete len:310 (-) Transcript_53318:412-1341(-)